MKKSPRPPVWRRCKYCRTRFEVTWNRGKEQVFCCANHRKLYWRYGALSFGKLMDRIERKITTEIRRALERDLDPVKLELAGLKQDHDTARVTLLSLAERLAGLRREIKTEAARID